MAKIEPFTGSDRYYVDTELAQAFLIARMLGKPLLLEGEPGTGKTHLALAYAEAEKLNLYEFDCKSGSDIEHLTVHYDKILRLMDAQMLAANANLQQAGLEQMIDLSGRSVDNINDYIRFGPMAKAFGDPNSVLLIDEIDKAPREFPNDLLYILGERKIIVPETGKVIETTKENMPTIVITSNREQALPGPFKGRCIYHFIRFPDHETMRKIVTLHHPTANDRLINAAVEVFYRLRELGLERRPSTREIIEWVDYLQQTTPHADQRSLERLPGYQTLLKDERDVKKIINHNSY